MAKSVLPELRDTLAPTVRELADAGQSSREMALEFIRRYPALVGQAQNELVLMALVQQVGTVFKRKSGPSLVPLQYEIFGYDLPPTIAVPREAGRKPGKIHKSLLKCTLEELDACIVDASRERRRRSDLVATLRRLRNEIAPHMKPGMLAEDGLMAARADHKSEASGTQ